MVIQVNSSFEDALPEENVRCINDLLKNANSSSYCNERGFRQKLIDLLYNLGYYRYNESIYASEKEQE